MLKHCVGILLFICCVALPVRAYADTYDVTASVLAPLPPTVPVVTGPTDNSVQQNPSVFVSGTCTIVVPNLIVVLIRDNQTVATGNCLPDGTFRILVGLVLGANVIYPKFVTITGQSSGYGQAITVSYEQQNQPVDASGNTTNTTTNDADKASIEKLKLDFNYDYVVYDTESVTKIAYTITGGKGPYEVSINWGDDTQKNVKLLHSGAQEAEHHYRYTLDSSSITVQVVDTEGHKVVQTRALVSFAHGLYVPPASAAAPPVTQKVSPQVVYFVGAGSLSGALLLSRFVSLGHPFAQSMTSSGRRMGRRITKGKL